MSSRLFWTDGRKRKWVADHPCRKKNGEITQHHKGTCENCGCCIACEAPPWCTEHKKKENARTRKSPLAIDEFLSPKPSKRLRQKKTVARTISPLGIVNWEANATVEERLNEFDQAADEERKRGNKLGNLFNKDLNDLEDLPTTQAKATKLLSLVTQMISHIAGQDQYKFEKIANRLVQGLDPSRKETEKLKTNIATLIIDGNYSTRQIMISLLLSSFTTNGARNLLLENNFSERRKAQVARNKAAMKSPDETVASRQFVCPFADESRNAIHRKNFKQLLALGADLPSRVATTKIDFETFASAIAFVYANTNYRPGQSRNTRVRGQLLKDLPVYRRYSSVDDLYSKYVESPRQGSPIGYNSFRSIVSTLTLKGTYNQGLSYFYTDFLEAIDLLQKGRKRLLKIAERFKGEPGKYVRELLRRLGRHTELGSKYLRHRFYGRITDSDSSPLYMNSKWALGAKDLKKMPTPDPTDPFLLLFTIRPLLYEIVDQVLKLLRSAGKTAEATANSAVSRLLSEVESFKKMADVLEKEFLHYTKHLVRGWWQETRQRDIINDLNKYPGWLYIILDHKSKTYCMKKNESMVEFFGKHGMSDLGAMIMWGGTKDDKPGQYVWFKDFIMDNVNSQGAKDILPCIEALLDELESKEFLEIYSNSTGLKRPKKIIFQSDNALCSRVYTPFVQLLNDRREIRIKEWLNSEAQRGKSFLDTHFRYVNQQLKTAVLDGNMKLSDEKAFFDCMKYGRGIKHSSVFLLRQLPEAQELHDLCKAVKFKDTKFRCIHRIWWKNSKETIHQHFTELESIKGGHRVLEGDLKPSTDITSCGTILKRHYAKGGPMFMANKAEDDSNNQGMFNLAGHRHPDGTLFAGRLFVTARWVHLRGVRPEQLVQDDPIEALEREDFQRRPKEEAEAQQLLESAKELSEARLTKSMPGDSTDSEEEDPVDCCREVFNFPPTSFFGKYWAMKSNKTYMKPTAETERLIQEMYDRGVGFDNKDIRYTAESAYAEMRDKHLPHDWGEQAVVNMALIKRRFNTCSMNEKKGKSKKIKKKKLRVEPEAIDVDVDADADTKPAADVHADPIEDEPENSEETPEEEQANAIAQFLEDCVEEGQDDAIVDG